MHNQLLRVTYAALSEVFAAAVKAGLKSATLRAALKDGMYGDGPLNFTPEAILSGSFDWSQYPYDLDILRKDLALATELGRALNVPMPLANLVEQEVIRACFSNESRTRSTPHSEEPRK